MRPWIAPDQTWMIWSVLLAGAAGSLLLEKRYRWAARLSAPVIAILLAMILSNAGVMPRSAPAYDVVESYLVPLAIPLLLFRAHLFRIIRSTGRLWGAFHLAAAGTLIGTAVAFVCLRGQLAEPAAVAGIMTGSYIGGGVNFFALKRSFEAGEHLTNPLLLADNFVMAGLFLALFLISSSRFFTSRYERGAGVPAPVAPPKDPPAGGMQPIDVALALAVAAVIAAAAHYLSGAIQSAVPWQNWKGVLGNVFLWITVLSVVAATLLPGFLESIRGAEAIGLFLLYLFLFQLGLPADLVSVFQKIPLLVLYCLLVAGINLLFTLAAGWALRFRLEELLVSVNATLGGAPSAAAMCAAKGWHHLTLPAILVGIWGYVIGTPLGLLAGKWLGHAWR